MKIHQVEQRSEEWHQLRKGKITGTGLKRILGTKTARDTYFLEVLADRLTVGSDDENAMERGERLEPEALEAFEKYTGKLVDKIGFCTREDNPFIASSPDGLIKVKGKYTEAVEVKCLCSAKHIKALLTGEIPEEYYPQSIQYFIVNDDLKKLYFVLYDPRVTMKPLIIIELHRSAIEQDIEDYRQTQIDFINEVEGKLSELIEI